MKKALLTQDPLKCERCGKKVAVLRGGRCERCQPRTLVVKYDVTGLSDEEIDALTMEAVVQGEPSDEHPSVEVTSEVVEG